MPAKSRAQQRLFQAAAHGANFGMAKKLRSSMTLAAMHDFEVGSEKGKPEHVKKAKAPHPHRNLGKYIHPKGGY